MKGEGFFFFFQAEDGIRDIGVTGVQTCALPISQDPATIIPFPQFRPPIEFQTNYIKFLALIVLRAILMRLEDVFHSEKRNTFEMKKYLRPV